MSKVEKSDDQVYWFFKFYPVTYGIIHKEMPEGKLKETARSLFDRADEHWKSGERDEAIAFLQKSYGACLKWIKSEYGNQQDDQNTLKHPR